MATPDYQPDFQEEELEQTQQTQLSTQQYSQPEADQVDSNTHLWGFLLPCSPRLRQLDFWRIQPTYTIGRGQDNAIRLPGMRISAFMFLRRRSLTRISDTLDAPCSQVTNIVSSDGTGMIQPLRSWSRICLQMEPLCVEL
jgi:hypothetical protein